MAFSSQGAAAGATAGAAFGPWGAAIGGIAGGFLGGSSVANPGGGSAANGGAVATPQATQAAAFGSGLDGSGWQVNFGSGSQTLDNRQDKTITSDGPIANASATTGRPTSPYGDYGMGYGGGMGYGYGDPLGMSALGLGGVPPMVWLVLGGAVLWRVARKSK